MSEPVWSDEKISRIVRDVTGEAGAFKPWHTVVDADMVTVLIKQMRDEMSQAGEPKEAPAEDAPTANQPGLFGER